MPNESCFQVFRLQKEFERVVDQVVLFEVDGGDVLQPLHVPTAEVNAQFAQ